MIRLDTNLVNQLGPNSLNNNSRSKDNAGDVDVGSRNQVSSFQFLKSDSKSFSMFQQTVHRRLEESLDAKFPTSKGSIDELEAKQRDERASLAANNILKFVELRLQQDVNDGSTTEQLESRLQAALEGFEQGYGEANDILKDMNLLSDEVEQDISLTKEKVLAGLASLKEQYVLGIEPDEQPKDIGDDTLDESRTVTADNQSIGQRLANYSALQVGEARDFSFELETKDGDLVTINASSLMAYQAEAGNGSQSTAFGEQQFSYLSEERFEQNNFAFSVTGELDEGELSAINDILNSVNDLAVDFYSGDVQTAFEKALEMGFDTTEISGFAFSMTHVTSVKAIQAYQPEQEILKPNVLSELKPIGKFATELARSLAVGNENFSHPKNLLSSILEQIDLQRKPEDLDETQQTFFEFAQSLLDKFAELPDAQPNSEETER